MSAALDRYSLPGSPTAPVRQVHLGLGAFHRAHQLAYTDLSDPEAQWGVAGFTGRRPDAAHVLERQDGLYTLVERGPAADRLRVVRSLSHAYDGAELAQLARLVASPELSIVTLTITEAGYCLGADQRLDTEAPAVVRDVHALAALHGSDDAAFARGLDATILTTAVARLAFALEARRRAGGAPISVVPCDNLPANGEILGAVVTKLGAVMGRDFTAWVATSVDFVSTVVDRITPATTEADIAMVERTTGFRDDAVVVTEPFTDWVLSGAFRAGRPQWERAGAQFVESVEPFEKRKLWMLNGAHTILASAGRLRGHETVSEAMGDDFIATSLDEWWNEAESCLPAADLALDDYRAALVARFSNPRIEHRLDQIAADSATKLAVRIAPVAVARLAGGHDATAAARAFGSWIAALELEDSHGEDIAAAMATRADDRAASLIRLVNKELAENREFVRDASNVANDFHAQSAISRRRN